jgi:DNA-binding GntR family transcriptional regulator
MLELQRGTKVSTRNLAHVLGMSAIPVREAITQLVGEGLLEHRPGVGTFVVNPSRLEIKDIYELRMVLESYAAKCAAMAVGSRGMKEMHQSVELMRLISGRAGEGLTPSDNSRLHEQWGIADASFHLAVLRRAGNHVAVKMVTGLRLMTRVFGHRISELRMQNLEDSHHEHLEILMAIEHRDPRKAFRLMRTHIRKGLAIALKHDEKLRREESGMHGSDHNALEELARQIMQLEARSD